MIDQAVTNFAVDRVKKVQAEKLQAKAKEWIKVLRKAEQRTIPFNLPVKLKQDFRNALEANQRLEKDLRTKIPDLAEFLDSSVEEVKNGALGFIPLLPVVVLGVLALTTGGIITANRYITQQRAELESAERRIAIYQETFDYVYQETGDAEEAERLAWSAVASAENEVMIRTLDERISNNRKKMLFFAVGGAGVLYALKKFKVI